MGLNAFTLFFTALGLSMDAFAVSVSNGMCYNGFGKREAMWSSLAFGVFQAGMPLMGYFAGRSFSAAISAFDHWIALGLLGFIGGKMLWDGWKSLRHPECASGERMGYSGQILLMQAIGTSIDAFAMGIGFAVMGVNIFLAAGFIGVITFACCIIGCLLGRRFGLLLGAKAQVAGGLVLVYIGLHIFLEHVL